MAEIIRTVHREEREKFERFLERCYGVGRGWFSRHYPDLYRFDEEAVQCWFVLDRHGVIVSHVGTYPLEIVVGPARVMCGGIGGVATLAHERGKGHMSRLMEESVGRMREHGVPLSALWGDQQRYRNFGYETCGVKHRLQITRRGFERAGISPAEVAEVDPCNPQVVSQVRELHAALPYRVQRPYLALKLQRPGLRVFLGPDGYLISHGEFSGGLDVQEVSSPTGHEAELILGALDITFGASADVQLGPEEAQRTARLLRVTSNWSAQPQGLLRIVDWPKLLQDLEPLLAQRAKGLPSFEIAIGCRWKNEVDWATVRWNGTALTVEVGRDGGDAIKLGVPELTAAVFGGPHPQPQRLGPLRQLLPVPLHIPSLDHV